MTRFAPHYPVTMPVRPPTLNTRPRPVPTLKQKTAERGYDAAWKCVRLHKLALTPLCEDCEEQGATTAASEVDHVTALTAGGTHSLANLRSLCKSCHSKKTVRVDGGLGHKAR